MAIIIEEEILVNKVETSDDVSVMTMNVDDESSLPNRYGLNGKSPYIGANKNWWEYDDTLMAYIDTGIAATDEELKSRVGVVETTLEDLLQKEVVIERESYLLFPTLGESNTIYIDTNTNKSYRWDATNLKYYILNDESFEIINGGN